MILRLLKLQNWWKICNSDISFKQLFLFFLNFLIFIIHFNAHFLLFFPFKNLFFFCFFVSIVNWIWYYDGLMIWLTHSLLKNKLLSWRGFLFTCRGRIEVIWKMMNDFWGWLIILNHFVVIKLTLVDFSGWNKYAHHLKELFLSSTVVIFQKRVMIGDEDEIHFLLLPSPLSSFSEESSLALIGLQWLMDWRVMKVSRLMVFNLCLHNIMTMIRKTKNK